MGITSIGFTGTQRGLTGRQSGALMQVLDRLHGFEIYEYHHGTCIGADAEFDALIRTIDNPGSTIHIHPPSNTSKIADCQSRPIGPRQVRVHPPKDYLDRNTDIVACSHILIACPQEYSEVLRSGTWATVRRAQKASIPFVLVFPDGTLKFSWQT